MNDQTLNIIRRAIDRGLDNDTIRDVLALSTMAPASTDDTTERPRPVSRTSHKTATTTRSTFTKPDTTRTLYRLTAAGRKLAATNPGGNNGEVLAYFMRPRVDNAWTDTRAMRSAGVLAHGEKDGKNKALESAIHGMKTKGLLTMRDKPDAPATSRNGGVDLD